MWFFSQDPLNINATGIAPSLLKVTVTPNTDGSRVTKYDVSSNGETCEITTSAGPLECELRNLDAATLYFVEAKACNSENVCGVATNGSGWTLPDGTLHRYFIQYIIAMTEDDPLIWPYLRFVNKRIDKR